MAHLVKAPLTPASHLRSASVAYREMAGKMFAVGDDGAAQRYRTLALRIEAVIADLPPEEPEGPHGR